MSRALFDPLPDREWNYAKARHLLRRAGFGTPIDRIERMSRESHEAAVQSLVHYERFPDEIGEPDFIEPVRSSRQTRAMIRRSMAFMNGGREPTTEEDKKKIEETIRRKIRERQRQDRRDIERLKSWWLDRMLSGRRPLEEKLTLFWHGHFAVSARKVKSSFKIYELNKLVRRMAAGNFKTLTYEVGVSPAMMQYLDNQRSNRRKPNENWARELMELFTLGEGNYTEEDIKSAARAFTGWTIEDNRFVYRSGQHDHGEKVFMGRKGNLNGNDIIDIIFEQPAASRFITRKLWTYFAYPDPEEEIVEALAQTLRENGFEIKPMLERMFRARAFYSDKAIASQIKSPAQLVVAMVSQLDVDLNEPTRQYLIGAMRRMGQDLFYPPNVKGWDGGKAWINTNTLLARYNLSDFLVQGVASDMKRGLMRIVREQREILEQTREKMWRKRRRNPGERGESPVESMETIMGMSLNDETGLVGDSSGPKGLRLPISPFNVRVFFKRAEGLRIDEIADFLAEYFYGRPIRADQKAEVIEALAGSMSARSILDVDHWDLDRLRAAVHLILSFAEYQLC